MTTRDQKQEMVNQNTSAAGRGRDITIDILRILGLIGVILAHCNIPGPFFEFREFDVTMLVLASGMSYACLSNHQSEDWSFSSWLHYVVKRFRRLILPVWLFLVVFFLFFHFFFGISYGLNYLVSSFALTSGGIQFVWVFRVFFTSAIFNPLLERIVSRKGSLWSGICFTLVLVVNEILISLSKSSFSGTALKLLNYIVFYTVSYAMISGLGIAIQRMQKKGKLISLAVGFVLWIGFGTFLGWPSLQDYKYPPQLYYISYGVVMTLGVSLLCSWLSVGKEKVENGLLLWLSTHSMDIYLAHIFVIYFVQAMDKELLIPWVPQFALYFGGSALLVLLFQFLFRKRS